MAKSYNVLNKTTSVIPDDDVKSRMPTMWIRKLTKKVRTRFVPSYKQGTLLPLSCLFLSGRTQNN